MKIQGKATGILERTSHYLKSGSLKQKPVWFDVMGSYPPHMDLTKKPKKFDTKSQQADPSSDLFKRNINNIYKTRSGAKERENKNRSIFRVPKLKFLEDQLRDIFYQQHPWEYSRPKNLVENGGNDNLKCDWSHMLQWNKPLDGESVVQRTVWILQDSKKNNKQCTIFEAYDKARFEFYRLRMEEEMSSTVSREESEMFGAVFSETYAQEGLKNEQEYIDVWSKVAGDKTKIREASKTGRNAVDNEATDSHSQKESIWENHFSADSVIETGKSAVA